MRSPFSRERLADLLVAPQEDLSLELKNWLDLAGDNEAKATFAKAALALANHGGGFILLGITDQVGGAVEALDRPATFDRYNQDGINGIIQNYADPPFHCSVHLVPDPAGRLFPVVVVPGGHKIPVRARRSGPNGQTIQQNAIYVRKPGPRSEPPSSAQDWDELLARCLSNRRDELLDQIRGLLTGIAPIATEPPAPARLDAWSERSLSRWNELRAKLPPADAARCPHGYHWFAYELGGELRHLEGMAFKQAIERAVVRHTGWPPFWYPTRDGIAPYPFDGAIECWLGGDTKYGFGHHEASHSDFWRISPDGLAFLLRGYQEDSLEGRINPPPSPGTFFDLTLPIWRAGEVLLHARSLASALVNGPATVAFKVKYTGLAGRTLTSLSAAQLFFSGGQAARQDEVMLSTVVDASSIEPNLPEIVQPLLEPLYALFDFYQPPAQLVAEQLMKLRSGRR